MSPTPPDGALLTGIDALLWVGRLLERVPTPVSVPQYRILRRVEAGGDRAARLAESLAVRKPTLTAVVDGLVQAGFLLRETDAADRRAVHLRLTDRGTTALRETERAYRDRVHGIAERLDDPDEFLTLVAGLRQPPPVPTEPVRS